MEKEPSSQPVSEEQGTESQLKSLQKDRDDLVRLYENYNIAKPGTIRSLNTKLMIEGANSFYDQQEAKLLNKEFDAEKAEHRRKVLHYQGQALFLPFVDSETPSIQELTKAIEALDVKSKDLDRMLDVVDPGYLLDGKQKKEAIAELQDRLREGISYLEDEFKKIQED